MIKKLVYLICWLSFLASGSPVAPQEAGRTNNILIFSSNDFRRPGISSIERGIRSAFDNYGPAQIQFFNEAQDEARIPSDRYESEMVEFLKHKYEAEKFDLIFAISPAALRFLLKHESELFTDIPKIFATVDLREVEDTMPRPNVTGVAGKLEFGSTIDLILRTHPETKHIVVITGSAAREEFYLVQAQKESLAYAGRLDFAYLSGLSIAELQKNVSTLAPNTVVLFVSYSRDTNGHGYSLPTALKVVEPYSRVPVYVSADIGVGAGGVGGSLLSFEMLGKRAGEVGLHILSGESPSRIPPQLVENVNMFDWRQLRRWNIDEQSLPPGSIVLFKEPTAWELYKWQIVGAVMFSILQTLFIGWLLFIRARRKKAEEESLIFAALAKAEHQKLDEVVANVPGIVWESRIGAGPDDRRIEYVSDYVETMLGFTPEEIEATPNFWRSVVLDEDHQKINDATAEILTGRGSGIQQFRCKRKDGVVIWVDAYLVATFDKAGNVVGIRGVAIDVTDRKLAEDELHKRELDLAEAQRLSQIGSWEWDPAVDLVRWSEELYHIAGMDPSQPAPNFQKLAKVYTKESYDRLKAVVATAIETGAGYELELEMIRQDGRHIWTNARGEALRDKDHKIVKLRGTLQDISHRKEAEEALNESEARYRNVVETQTEMICRYLPDTTLTFVNDAYCRYFGKTREQLIGTKFIELVPKHARDVSLGHIASMLNDPQVVTYEHEVIKSDGTRGWHQWTDSVVETSNGHPCELQGIGRDITETRLAEEELRASENRFRIMADSAPVLIWMCGPDKLCTYVNQGWVEFTGRSAEMEMGSGWTAGIHSDDAESTSDFFDEAFEKRQTFRLEYRLRRADGTYRWVYDTGTPRFASDGQFLGFIGSCVDITDRKVAEDEAKQAHEEVKQLQAQLQEENIYLKEVIKLEHNFDEIIGQSDAIKYVLFKIEQVAPTDATVLITGETGTGKELVARALHNTSPRKDRPLVMVNCAALSASLIESELFGHERGSFTGASARKIGRFELADGATIFLDEVGELPIELQSKLLRVIQEGEFERLGSSKTIKVDVRIIAATNRNLEAEVKKGTFREDLLFRLNVFPITVPPLRERKGDLPILIEHFTNRFSKNSEKIFDRSRRRQCANSANIGGPEIFANSQMSSNAR